MSPVSQEIYPWDDDEIMYIRKDWRTTNCTVPIYGLRLSGEQSSRLGLVTQRVLVKFMHVNGNEVRVFVVFNYL